jgi:hypothetical protein
MYDSLILNQNDVQTGMELALTWLSVSAMIGPKLAPSNPKLASYDHQPPSSTVVASTPTKSEQASAATTAPCAPRSPSARLDPAIDSSLAFTLTAPVDVQ